MDSILEGRRDLFENYRLGQFIARGLNQVYEVTHIHNQSVKCAKLVHLNDVKEMEYFKKEISFLEATKMNPHPHIICYDGYYIHEEKGDQFHVINLVINLSPSKRGTSSWKRVKQTSISSSKKGGNRIKTFKHMKW